MKKANGVKLGVNIDHVATLRQARLTNYPDPSAAAFLAEKSGCDSIVAHLRKDRRHIQDKDIFLIKDIIKIPLNLEMSVDSEIVKIALRLKPKQATLVPENRRELTTEGGIDLIKKHKVVAKTVESLTKKGIEVSLFIDPVKRQINAAKSLGVSAVEINSGRFSQFSSQAAAKKELIRIEEAAVFAGQKGLFVAAGHGLDYENIKQIRQIKQIQEFNIGHSIICRSLFIGIVEAVGKMVKLIKANRR